MSRVLSKLWSSAVFYIISYLNLGLVLNIKLILMLDLGLNSLSIFFIVRY